MYDTSAVSFVCVLKPPILPTTGWLAMGVKEPLCWDAKEEKSKTTKGNQAG